MAKDWKSNLRRLRERCRLLLDDGDSAVFHHIVMLVDPDAGPIAEPPFEGLWAPQDRVTLRFDVPLPDRWIQRHFFFEEGESETATRDFDLYRSALSDVRTTLATLPKKVAPEIRVPVLENGEHEGLARWHSVLHWLGGQTHVVFNEQVEFLPNAESRSLSPWEVASSRPDFDPIAVLTLSDPKHGPAEWKELHETDGRTFPVLLSASFTKPLLYVAVNAVELLLGRVGVEGDRGGQRAGRPPAPGTGLKGLNFKEYHLLTVLMEHHQYDSESPVKRDMSQREMADALGCAQSTVSKRLKSFLNKTQGEGSRMDPQARYKAMCESGTIIGALKVLADPSKGAKELLERFEAALKEQQRQREREEEERIADPEIIIPE